MAPSLATARTQYRELVAQVAERARAILPAAVNGRVEKAVALVLLGEVHPQADGTITVGSCTDPAKVYHLVGTSCDCADYPRAPESWCKHRIAAGIAKRVQELLPQSPGVETGAPVAPLGEAPCSVNVHVTIAGRQVQVTLRGTDEAEVLQRLEALLARYPVPQAPAQSNGQVQPLSPQQHNAMAQHRPGTGFCAVHNCEMKLNHGKDGRTWHSHFDEAAGTWCKGR